LLCDAFEGVRPPGGEVDLGSQHELRDGGSDEHLTRLREGGDPGADMYRDAGALVLWYSISPVCRPARISRSISRTASRMAHAQRMARVGPSNVAKKPSPAVSISVPP
jgi:hypothetical protein